MNKTYIDWLTNNKSDIKMQSTPASASPLNNILKFQFSNLPLIRKFSSTPEKDINPFTVLTIHQVFILIFSTLFMIVILQIPTILYFTITSQTTISSSFTSIIDFKTCSVSSSSTHLKYVIT